MLNYYCKKISYRTFTISIETKETLKLLEVPYQNQIEPKKLKLSILILNCNND